MKLSGWVYLVIGLSIAGFALSLAYFQHYGPDMEDAKAREAYAEALAIEGRKEAAADVRIEHAQADVQRMAEEWIEVVKEKTPPRSLAEGGINLSVNPYQIVVDAPTYRNSLQRAINRQMRYGGVTVLSGGSRVPQPPDDAASIMNSFFNYSRLPFPVVMVDVGTITVRGRFEQIAANMAGWSEMPNYLAVADGLTITGTSPNLVGTYNVSIVGFMHGGVTGPMGSSSPFGAAFDDFLDDLATGAGAPAPGGGGGGRDGR